MKKLAILFLLFSSCGVTTAGTTPEFYFLEIARNHYREQHVSQPAIDSLLNLYSVKHDFKTAYNASWYTGQFFLEKGKHAIALDIFNNMRRYMDGIADKKRKELIITSALQLVIGAIYEETGLWNEAIELYMNSLQICRETGSRQGMANVYNNLGSIYFKRNELKKADSLYNMAVVINRSLNNKKELFNNYINLAGIYKEQQDLKKSLEYALIALSQLDINRDFYDLSVAYMNLGCIYLEMGNYTVALSYYEQSASIRNEKGFYYTLVESYLSIFNLYDHLKNTEKSEFYLHKAIEVSNRLKNPDMEKLVVMAAATYYNDEGKPAIASKYFQRYCQLSDSLGALNTITKIEQVQAVYEVINKEKDNKILSQKLNLQEMTLQRQSMVIFAAILIFLLLGLLIFYLHRNRKLERKRNEMMINQSESLHQKEKEVLLQEEESLKLELDYKNRQLTSYVLHLARNSEFITQTIEELKQLLIEIHPRDKERSQCIRNIISKLQQYSIGNDWEEFRLYFEEVHPSFEKNLTTRYPDLSPNDKKICALLKLGLTTKDIASITFRELRSVESARNRLRRKLGIGIDMNIQTFLSRF